MNDLASRVIHGERHDLTVQELQLLRQSNIKKGAFTRAVSHFVTAGRVAKVLDRNPYLLMKVFKIGFHTADDAAMALGLSETDSRRLVAMIEFVCNESSECYWTGSDLLEVMTSKKYKFFREDAREAIKSAFAEGKLVLQYGFGWLDSIAENEQDVANYFSE